MIQNDETRLDPFFRTFIALVPPMGVKTHKHSKPKTQQIYPKQLLAMLTQWLKMRRLPTNQKLKKLRIGLRKKINIMGISVSMKSFVEILGKTWGSGVVDSVVSRFSDDLEVSRMEQLGFWECPRCGVSFALKDELYLQTGGVISTGGPLVVIGIHFYSAGYEGYARYEGELLGGVCWGDSAEVSREKLGAPSQSGGGNKAVGKIWPRWDRYDFSDHSIRIQYSGDYKIDMVTLIAPSERG